MNAIFRTVVVFPYLLNITTHTLSASSNLHTGARFLFFLDWIAPSLNKVICEMGEMAKRNGTVVVQCSFTHPYATPQSEVGGGGKENVVLQPQKSKQITKWNL